MAATEGVNKMIASFKIISLASALSAGIVTAYDLPQVRDSAAPMGKTYYDRVLPSEPVEGSRAVTVAATMPETTGSVAGATQSGKSDQLRTDPTCASQTWPNISRDCLVAENGTPVRKAARTITIEKREGANTSILVRVPTTGVASR
jgi:hypothetical protein